MIQLALILLCLNPVEDVPQDRCSVLFVEHFYDDQGRLVFDQLVPLDWNPAAERYDVVCWRLIKSPSMFPKRDWANGGYVVTFWDGDLLRTIRAPSFREEWSQTDSELEARSVLGKEKRRELRTPRVETKTKVSP